MYSNVSEETITRVILSRMLEIKAITDYSLSKPFLLVVPNLAKTSRTLQCIANRISSLSDNQVILKIFGFGVHAFKNSPQFLIKRLNREILMQMRLRDKGQSYKISRYLVKLFCGKRWLMKLIDGLQLWVVHTKKTNGSV